MTTTSLPRPATRDLIVLVLLFAIGLFYIGSYVVFVRDSRDIMATRPVVLRAADIAVPGEVFLGSGGCLACLRSGWNEAGEYGVNSRGSTAVLALRLPEQVRAAGRDLAITLDAGAYLPTHVRARRMTVEANGMRLGEVTFRRDDPRHGQFVDRTAPFLHRFVVPASALAADPVLLVRLAIEPIEHRWTAGAMMRIASFGVVLRRLSVAFDGDTKP